MLRLSAVLKLFIYFCSVVNAAIDRNLNPNPLSPDENAYSVSSAYIDEFIKSWIQNSVTHRKTGESGVNEIKITNESFSIGGSREIMKNCIIEEKEILCLDIGKKSGKKLQYPIKIRIHTKIKPVQAILSRVHRISRAQRLKRGADEEFYNEGFDKKDDDKEYNKGFRFRRDENEVNDDDDDNDDDETTEVTKKTTKSEDIDDDEDEEDDDYNMTAKNDDNDEDEDDKLIRKKGKKKDFDSEGDDDHDGMSRKQIGKKKKNGIDDDDLRTKIDKDDNSGDDDEDKPNKAKDKNKKENLEDNDEKYSVEKYENDSGNDKPKSKKIKNKTFNYHNGNNHYKLQKKKSGRKDEDSDDEDDEIDKLYKMRTQRDKKYSEDDEGKLKQMNDDQPKKIKREMRERDSDEDDDENYMKEKVDKYNKKNSNVDGDANEDVDDETENDGKPHWKRCQVPKPHKTTEALCKMMPHQMICHLYCVFGHTYPEGIMRRTICDFKIGKWSKEFTECKPFVDCTLKLRREGYLKCLTNTVRGSPKCTVGCEEETRPHNYRCDEEGRWKPELPHCVTLEGIELVEPPETLMHNSIGYPK